MQRTVTEAEAEAEAEEKLKNTPILESKDADAQGFWHKHFKRQPGVMLVEFASAMDKNLKETRDFELPSWAMKLFGKVMCYGTDDEQKMRVEAKEFADALRRFGPMKKLIDNMAAVEGQAWFRPRCSRNEAEAAMRADPGIPFILRYSSAPTEDFVCTIRSGPYLEHRLIRNEPTGYQLVLLDTERNARKAAYLFRATVLDVLIQDVGPLIRHIVSRTRFYALQNDLIRRREVAAVPVAAPVVPMSAEPGAAVEAAAGAGARTAPASAGAGAAKSKPSIFNNFLKSIGVSADPAPRPAKRDVAKAAPPAVVQPPKTPANAGEGAGAGNVVVPAVAQAAVQPPAQPSPAKVNVNAAGAGNGQSHFFAAAPAPAPQPKEKIIAPLTQKSDNSETDTRLAYMQTNPRLLQVARPQQPAPGVAVKVRGPNPLAGSF